MSFKLVRDNNQAWTQKHGVSGTWKVASPDELLQAITAKIGEEYGEYASSAGREVDELLDLIDVLDAAIAWWRNNEPETLDDAETDHRVKARIMGGFSEGVLWNPVPPGALGEEVR